VNSAALLRALAGGALIGTGSALLLLLNGRIAGVSGILGNTIRAAAGEEFWRVAFLLGLLLPAFIFGVGAPQLPQSWACAVASGLLVGVGTQLGGGCTSGHGVCGLANLSTRSLVATLLFMTAAVVTVFVVRHGCAGNFRRARGRAALRSGLLVSGMTNPANVLLLRHLRRGRPQLAIVMGAAVLTAVPHSGVRRSQRSLLAAGRFAGSPPYRQTTARARRRSVWAGASAAFAWTRHRTARQRPWNGVPVHGGGDRGIWRHS
jgi:hypothetical protein